MSDIDPDTLLELLHMGQSDVTLLALEQLCTILLLSDNIDRCFESYPPRSFLPALCKIFLDETATEATIEACARAITYYLDVSQECTRRIVNCPGTIRAICTRLQVVERDNKTSRDIAEQCIKSLELICQRESSAVLEAGGLTCILPFINEHGRHIYKDSLYSAMSVVARLCARVDTADPSLDAHVRSLTQLLEHEDAAVANGALRCFHSLVERFARKSVDPLPLARHGLVQSLVNKLAANSPTSSTMAPQPAPAAAAASQSASGGGNGSSGTTSDVTSVSALIGLLSSLCRSSSAVMLDLLLETNILEAVERALCAATTSMSDERCVLDTMRFVDMLLALLFEGRGDSMLLAAAAASKQKQQQQQAEKKQQQQQQRTTTNGNEQQRRWHRQLIESIRLKDTGAFVDLLESQAQSIGGAGLLDVNATDDAGQTLLNWSAAFGTAEMCEHLVVSRGADVNAKSGANVTGSSSLSLLAAASTSLHYAACMGRASIVETLLRLGADVSARDHEGKTALERAREQPTAVTHAQQQQRRQRRRHHNHNHKRSQQQQQRQCIRLLVEAQSAALVGGGELNDDDEDEDEDEDQEEDEDEDDQEEEDGELNDALDDDDDDDEDDEDDEEEDEMRQHQQQQQQHLIMMASMIECEASLLVNSSSIDTHAASEEQDQEETTTTTTAAKSERLSHVKLAFTKRLTPLLCKLYVNGMLMQATSKPCLGLLRKLIGYAAGGQQLDDALSNEQATSSSNKAESALVTLLVELIAKVLQNGSGSGSGGSASSSSCDETCLIGLGIISELLAKCGQASAALLVDELVRLGVGHTIGQLAARHVAAAAAAAAASCSGIESSISPAPIVVGGDVGVSSTTASSVGEHIVVEEEENEEEEEEEEEDDDDEDEDEPGVGVGRKKLDRRRHDQNREDDDDDDDDEPEEHEEEEESVYEIIEQQQRDTNAPPIQFQSENIEACGRVVCTRKVYVWSPSWSLVHCADFTYVWSKHCAIELSPNSNGWFRFLVNDRLYSMYSNGKPELVGTTTTTTNNTSTDPAATTYDETRAKFVAKLAKAKRTVDWTEAAASDVMTTSRHCARLFSAESSGTEIKIDNWILRLVVQTQGQDSAAAAAAALQLHILNKYATQRIVLRACGTGLEFESNKKETLRFVANAPLIHTHNINNNNNNNEDGEDTFANPYLAKFPPPPSGPTPSKKKAVPTPLAPLAAPAPPTTQSTTAVSSSQLSRFTSLQSYFKTATAETAKARAAEMETSVTRLAHRLNERYFRQVHEQPRALLTRLAALVDSMRAAISVDNASLELYESALVELRLVLAERHRAISCYELARSGLVPALLASLVHSPQRRAIFARVFQHHQQQQQQQQHDGDDNETSSSPVGPLVRKLVALCESHERLPVYMYDPPGTYNLQAFVKRFKLVLTNGDKQQQTTGEEKEKEKEEESNLLDFSGRVIRVEPLANVSHLERYIGKMTTKQWYDYERAHIYGLRWLAERAPVHLAYESDFDRNGLLYFVGTNGTSAGDWINPHTHKSLVRVSMSSGGLVSGRVDDLIGRAPAYAHTAGEEKRAWFAIDLGVHLIPSAYTLRHSRALGNASTRTAPRNWTLLMSKTGGSTCDDWQVVSGLISSREIKLKKKYTITVVPDI